MPGGAILGAGAVVFPTRTAGLSREVSRYSEDLTQGRGPSPPAGPANRSSFSVSVTTYTAARRPLTRRITNLSTRVRYPEFRADYDGGPALAVTYDG